MLRESLLCSTGVTCYVSILTLLVVFLLLFLQMLKLLLMLVLLLLIMLLMLVTANAIIFVVPNAAASHYAGVLLNAAVAAYLDAT